MALSYTAVADGHNVAEGSLVRVEPPPATPDQLQYSELEFYGDGHADFNGFKSGELVWTSISSAERATVLTAFGLSDEVASNDVTLNHLLNTGAWQRSNVTAVYLQSDRRRPYGHDDLRIAIQRIEAAS